MNKIVAIQDDGDYYTIDQQNITNKVVDKNVIIATEMKESDFEEKYGNDVDHYAMETDSRHLIRTDHGLLFFDEETKEKIILSLV